MHKNKDLKSKKEIRVQHCVSAVGHELVCAAWAMWGVMSLGMENPCGSSPQPASQPCPWTFPELSGMKCQGKTVLETGNHGSNIRALKSGAGAHSEVVSCLSMVYLECWQAHPWVQFIGTGIPLLRGHQTPPFAMWIPMTRSDRPCNLVTESQLMQPQV